MADLEDFAREPATEGNELYIHSGGYGNGGSGSNGGFTTSIAERSPCPPASGRCCLLPFEEDDLTRINTRTRVIAVDRPNTQSANALEWYDYRTSLDVLNALSTELQRLLEVGVDAGPVNSGQMGLARTHAPESGEKGVVHIRPATFACRTSPV